MAEPAALTTAPIEAAGLVILGVATGLHPPVMLAGFAGGLWALSYLPVMVLWQRALVAVLGACAAGWFAPFLALLLDSFEWFPSVLTAELIQYPVAVLIGLLAHTVIGPAVIRISRAKAEEVAK